MLLQVFKVLLNAKRITETNVKPDLTQPRPPVGPQANQVDHRFNEALRPFRIRGRGRGL